MSQPVEHLRILGAEKGLTRPRDPVVNEETVGALVYLTKASTLNPPVSTQVEDVFADLYDKVLQPPIEFDRLLLLFETQPIHSSCCLAKAMDAVGQGWRLSPEDQPPLSFGGVHSTTAAGGSNKKMRAQESALNQTLEDITPDLTFSEMLQQAAREQEIFGWGVWEAVRDEPTMRRRTVRKQVYAPIRALYPLPGHQLRAARVKGLYVQSEGVKRRWFKRFGEDKVHSAIDGHEETTGNPIKPEDRATEIIIFKTYTPRSRYYPIPEWISAAPAMAELSAIREYNISWFSSGGTADRIVVATSADEAVAKKVTEEIQNKIKEFMGRGHVTITVFGTPDLKVDVKQMNAGTGRGEGNRERQFRGGREDLVKEVLMAHRTPPYRVGWADIGALGGNAAKEMLRTYRLGGVGPIQIVIEDRLNQTLFGPKGFDLKGARWELIDLDWDAMEMNIEKATKGVQNGFLTPNQARTMTAQPTDDKPELDEYYINGIPLSQAGQAPAKLTPAAGGDRGGRGNIAPKGPKGKQGGSSGRNGAK